MINAIESHHKDKFRYLVTKDAETTGRFEVTVYKNQTDDKGEGVIIHSRLQTKTFVHENYEEFLDLVEESIAK